MIIPKKLQIVRDHEVLEEVSRELKIDIKDVRKTYNIWLDFLNHIANETDQATVTIPNIGQMYICAAKLRRNYNSNKFKKFKERKLKEIQETAGNCEHNVHEKTIPIILKYGLAKKNIIENIKKGIPFKEKKPKFYTKNEIIDNQNDIFFREDKDYRENEKLKKYFNA